MSDSTFAHHTSEIEGILALDRFDECGACSPAVIVTAHDVITALEYWWLSPDVRDVVGTHTYIEVHENQEKHSCSIRLKFENPTRPKVDHAVLIIIQHHLTGKPKIHYQLQFPCTDAIKNLPASEFKTEAQARALDHRAKVDKYRDLPRVSISLEEPRGDAALLELQQHMLEFVGQLLQLSRKYPV